MEPRPNGAVRNKHPLQKSTRGKTLKVNDTRGRRPASCGESAPLRRSCQPGGAGAWSGSPGPRGRISPPPGKRRPGPGRCAGSGAAGGLQLRFPSLAAAAGLPAAGLGEGRGARAGSSSGRQGLLSLPRSRDRGRSRSLRSPRVAAGRGRHSGGAQGQDACGGAGVAADSPPGLRTVARGAAAGARGPIPGAGGREPRPG
uniref:uncharacterized PE-PGRS family protein PE_PGRS54-like n=1 Tax=Callithrix jacchus TaxID=9483 RepID=UPI0008402689|nr:uncharacterized PE-PGRS family protein PE_PGRS54-like [Callithrix jacchus]